MALDYDTVVEAASAILRNGQNPSASRVIERLGHGSKSTALKHLSAWREHLHTAGYNLPPSMPSALGEAVETFWQAACDQAGHAFDTERSAIEARLEEVEAQRAELEANLKALRTEHEELYEHAERASNQVQQLEQERASLNSQIEALTTQLESERQEHAKAIAHKDTEREALRKTLEARIAERDESLREDRKRFEASEDKWVMELDKTRGQIREADERLSAERERFESERNLLRHEIDAKAQRASEFEAQKLRCEHENAALSEQLEQAREAHTERLNALSAELDAVRTERDESRANANRLHTLLDNTLEKLSHSADPERQT